MRHAIRWACGALCLAGTGCLEAVDEHEDGAITTVPDPGALAVDPQSLDFGAVAAGSGATLALTVEETLSGAVDATFVWEGPADFSFAGLPASTHFSPLGVLTVDVTFTPQGGGEAAGTLRIAGAEAGELAVPIGGTGIE